MQRQIDQVQTTSAAAMRAALDAATRFNTEQDRRYEERFAAQEMALQLALTRSDNMFSERLVQVRNETRAALEAADKAITKSDTATEKRFESVNEFRAQLTDQAQRFMPRLEAEQRMSTNTEKIAVLEAHLTTDLQNLTSRLDQSQGSASGMDKAWAYLLGAVGLMGSITAIVLATR